MLLTYWADSLIDHDEKPRELYVLSRGQCDLWDNHQGCLEQRVIPADTHSQPHNVFFTLMQLSFHVQKGGPWRGAEGGGGLTTSFQRWKRRPGTEALQLNLEEGSALPH